MRGVIFLAATMILAGCASEDAVQSPAITKTATRDKVAAKGIYQCLPEPEGGCIRIQGRSACLAHGRCEWVKGDDAGDAYCRRIYC